MNDVSFKLLIDYLFKLKKRILVEKYKLFLKLVKSNVRRIKDDLGKTIDEADNLAKMIMIEQAIDAAYEIEEPISRSYAFCDCIIAISEFARETNSYETLERTQPLLEQITNSGATARALSYLAVVLSSLNYEEEAEKALLDAIKYASKIKEDFDRRDALLEIATSAADMSFLLDKRKLVNLGLQFQDQLTQGQKAYLFGYLSTVIPSEEGTQLMREAMNIASQINDPITRSKVSLELATLLTSITKEFEE